jgi:hypothetical protein
MGMFLALLIWGLSLQIHAQVLLAGFDDLTMGFVGKSFTDGGITFSNLDMRGGPSRTFAIQTSLKDTPGFSPPNYLIFGAYSPQPGFLLTRFGSLDITFSGEATAATVYAHTVSSANILTLQAFQNGNVVAAETLFASEASSGFAPLTVLGEFDRLRLVASGAYDNGAILLGIDNVSVTIIPEPHINGLVAAGLTLLALAYVARRSGSPS